MYKNISAISQITRILAETTLRCNSSESLAKINFRIDLCLQYKNGTNKSVVNKV